MNISLQGFNTSYATFIADSTAEAGKAVVIKSAYTVGKPTAVAPLMGVITSKRDDNALVQMSGTVALAYTGTAPALGYTALASDTAGNAIANEAGRKVLVVAVDTTSKIVTFII